MVEEETAVGVPLIAPVDVLNERPDGSDGETDHDVAVPPDVVGVLLVMATPLVKVIKLGL